MDDATGFVRAPAVELSHMFYPEVAGSLKPAVGMAFPSIDHAFEFYKEYAKEGGFGVRKCAEYSRGGVIFLKHFTCSRAGHKPSKRFDSIEEFKKHSKNKKARRLSSVRCGCPARLVLKKIENQPGYFVRIFTEEHNHLLVSKSDMQFMTSNRSLSYIQENTLMELANLNLGPVKSFHIMRTMYGGFEKIGATATDCKNWRRDLNCFIGEYDAEFIVRRQLDKKEYLDDYSFHYSVDDNGVLTNMFWADQLCKINYSVFGGVMSFDATFNTNKYKMVFVPFTGIDNHFRNVTFGAGLLSNETAESYKWLLEKFLLSFGEAPKVVVTDQDLAMKQAIQEVFPGSRHRLCMWHIMRKLADKVGPVLCNNEQFKKDMCNIVWTDQITPEVFESSWRVVMDTYGIGGNAWLIDMFDMRSMWIPAYYRDEPMSGLMRTTSRSESENHFFRKAKNSQLTLLEFFEHYETALEVQRYNHKKNDFESRHKFPDLWTDHPIELEASRVFTRFIFADQQYEISEATKSLLPFNHVHTDEYATVSLRDNNAYGDGLIEVTFDKVNYTATCQCRRFEQYGVLCKHIYYMLIFCKLEHIPEKYILKRWRQDAVPSSTTNSSYRHKNLIKENVAKTKEVIAEIMFGCEYVVDRLVNDFDKLCKVRDQVKALMEKADEAKFGKPAPPKKDRIAHILGVQKSSDLGVRVPTAIRNKGRGSHVRIKSKREIAISQAGRRRRECQHCHEVGHDIRTCATLKAQKLEVAQAEAASKGKEKVHS